MPELSEETETTIDFESECVDDALCCEMDVERERHELDAFRLHESLAASMGGKLAFIFGEASGLTPGGVCEPD